MHFDVFLSEREEQRKVKQMKNQEEQTFGRESSDGKMAAVCDFLNFKTSQKFVR